MVRLIQLSDIHFGGENAASAQAAADFIERDPPELVIFTGDFTLNGLPREFRSAKRWFDALPQPKLATPGNHDTPYWNIPLRALTPFNRYRRNIGPPGSASFDSEDVSVRMINTSRGAQPRPDWSKGAINLKTAHADVAALKGAHKGALRVIGCHHPLIEVADTPVTGGVHRGALAAEIFALGRIDLILTGHVHVPFAVPLPYGDGMTYAVGASTLSVRTRGVAAGFNLIEADARNITVTAMDWVDLAFQPGRTWSLERRQA
jgi:3',5'-cyclic AMP phosphodiesterase CpdA